ncbi:MAG: OsmC family protein [Flavobacteriaceae bacterium]|nr:OsmC family protein [Flavobacteriaceae bacterium]
MKIQLTKDTNSSHSFTAKNNEGFEVKLSNSSAGKPTGPSPMETVLMAVAGCSSIDIVHILEKQNLSIENLHVDVEGFRRDEVPKVFTQIKLIVQLDGKISASKALRACQLSFEKYCSVSKMLEGQVEILYDLILNGKKVEKL